MKKGWHIRHKSWNVLTLVVEIRERMRETGIDVRKYSCAMAAIHSDKDGGIPFSRVPWVLLSR